MACKTAKKKWMPCYRMRNFNLRDLGYSSYKEYLASDDWQKLRAEALAANPVCAACDSPASQVHHLDYGFETLLGLASHRLVAICRTCHHDIEFDGKTKRTLQDANRALFKKANGTERGRAWIVRFDRAQTAFDQDYRARKESGHQALARRSKGPRRKAGSTMTPEAKRAKEARATFAPDSLLGRLKVARTQRNTLVAALKWRGVSLLHKHFPGAAAKQEHWWFQHDCVRVLDYWPAYGRYHLDGKDGHVAHPLDLIAILLARVGPPASSHRCTGFIKAGASSNGGWSQEQLALLGVEWPPQKGWQNDFAKSGVPWEVMVRFVALKDRHLRPS